MIKNFIDLIFPNRCFSCSKIITASKDILCLTCISELPLSNDYLIENNSFKQEVKKEIDVELAFSLFTYPKNGVSRKLIHELKYNNKPRIGKVLGEYFIEQTKEYFFNEKVDGIVYVPITKNRKLKRGYNQLENFAYKIAEKLNVPVIENYVYRDKFKQSQIKYNKLERLKNLEKVFKINNVNDFNYSHLLVLDDVFTTGATLLSLISTIKEKNDVKISVGVISFNK